MILRSFWILIRVSCTNFATLGHILLLSVFTNKITNRQDSQDHPTGSDAEVL